MLYESNGFVWHFYAGPSGLSFGGLPYPGLRFAPPWAISCQPFGPKVLTSNIPIIYKQNGFVWSFLFTTENWLRTNYKMALFDIFLLLHSAFCILHSIWLCLDFSFYNGPRTTDNGQKMALFAIFLPRTNYI